MDLRGSAKLRAALRAVDLAGPDPDLLVDVYLALCDADVLVASDRQPPVEGGDVGLVGMEGVAADVFAFTGEDAASRWRHANRSGYFIPQSVRELCGLLASASMGLWLDPAGPHGGKAPPAWVHAIASGAPRPPEPSALISLAEDPGANVAPWEAPEPVLVYRLSAVLKRDPAALAGFLVRLADSAEEDTHGAVCVWVETTTDQKRRQAIARELHSAARSVIGTDAIFDIACATESDEFLRRVRAVVRPFYKSALRDEPRARYLLTLDHVDWEAPNVPPRRLLTFPDGHPVRVFQEGMDSLISRAPTESGGTVYRLGDQATCAQLAGMVGRVFQDGGYFDTVAVLADIESPEVRQPQDWVVEVRFGPGTLLAPFFFLPYAPLDLLSQVVIARGSRFRVAGTASHGEGADQHRHLLLDLLERDVP